MFACCDLVHELLSNSILSIVALPRSEIKVVIVQYVEGLPLAFHSNHGSIVCLVCTIHLFVKRHAVHRPMPIFPLCRLSHKM